MSEIKLFRISGTHVQEIGSKSIGLEKSLQTTIERNLEAILGVRFLCSEHPTGKSHAGRIDTLGLDENGCPAIIEYKRSLNENVINQGLFYLDWLLDHKAEFKLMVMETLGNAPADIIDWSGPRLICIASDFTKYDEHAVKQINRNIELIRYRRFGEELLALELMQRVAVSEPPQDNEPGSSKPPKKSTDKPFCQWLEDLDAPMRDLYESLRAFILALGDDVSEKQLKLYAAYRRIKNFASIVIQKKALLLYLKVNPEQVTLEPGFARDVRRIGHWATGDLEITISDKDALLKAQPLIARSYDEG